MKLPLPFFDKKEKADYFLATLLRDEKIKIILFEEIDAKIKVLGMHEEHFSTSLENAQTEEWVDVFDKAIGTVENLLPGDTIVRKTVFGVKGSWTEEGKIKKEYLAKLKKISDELELQPIGFLVFSEAIIHLLTSEQGAPVSGILVETGKHTATITILRAGKLIETHTKPIVDSPTQTVDEMLKHVTQVEILPSKIFLFDSDNIGEISQEFIKHQWSKALPFLHVPQVSVLSKDFDAKAVIEGTAAQMGLEVTQQALGIPEDMVIADEEPKKPEEPEEPKVTDAPEEKEEETLDAHAFGFVQNADIAILSTPEEHPSSAHIAHDDFESRLTEEENIQKPVVQKKASRIVIGLVHQLKNKLKKPNFSPKKPLHDANEYAFAQPEEKLRTRQSKTRIPKIVFLIPLILIALVLGFIWYMMTLKATVILTLNPKIIEDSHEVTFSTDSENSFDNNILHGTVVDISEDGSVSTQTTGTKDEGTQAKGTITIFNNNDSSKTVTAGTTVLSSNNLKFTLDKDVTIASAAGDIFSGTKPGTADASITASTFGTEYNLPSGTKFTLSGNSNLAAKNNNAFSGGTKKQITVVSKDDSNKLLTQLPDSLQSKAKEQLSKGTSTDKEVLPLITNYTIEKKKFDKNPGDEAKTVTLTATVSYKSIAYDKQAMLDYAKHTLQDKTDPNLSLMDNGLTTTIDNVTAKNENVANGTVKLHASFAPHIDTQKIKKDIAGKSITEAEHILSGLPQYESVKVILNPAIFFLPKVLPKFDTNITITTEVQ